MATDHAVTVPSKDNLPDPSASFTDPTQAAATPEAPVLCNFPCTVPGHVDTVELLWDGAHLTPTEAEDNDPEFGTVIFTFAPPLTGEGSAA
jgi:hypothetical protein